jgi:hypothetical protein
VAPKPKTVAGYPREQAELVHSTCLYLATILGDLMESVVIVGGFAPSLLIDQRQLRDGVEPHPGTLDLDIGLHAAVLDEKLYQSIADRLRGAGFKQGTNDAGNVTRQSWVAPIGDGRVTVDFLIQPTLSGDKGGQLRNLETDFAAIIAPGLHLAFEDKIRLKLSGVTILGERAEREVSVCGPGAFTVLKALAFRIRGENKDAFDLYYVVRNYGSGTEDVARALAPLIRDENTLKALKILREDFSDPEALGPKRAANFLFGRNDDAMQADVVGVLLDLLSKFGPN